MGATEVINEHDAERALVARLRARDTAAFDEAYDRYRPRVFGFLLRLTQQRALAEDLLQETFLRLATKASGLAEDTRVQAWLFTVARNLFLSHRRWVLLDLDRIGALGKSPAPPPPTPYERSAARETNERLERALARLPVKYREVMLLVAVEGLSPSEAAVIVDVKPEALRQRLRRAREMLADALVAKEERGTS